MAAWERVLVVVVVVVACMVGRGEAWGSYSCNLTPKDKEGIANATLKSAQQVDASVASLAEKMDTILALLQPPVTTPHAPWIPSPPPTQGPIDAPTGNTERSEREERSREDIPEEPINTEQQKENKIVNREQVRGDRVNREQKREDGMNTEHVRGDRINREHVRGDRQDREQTQEEQRREPESQQESTENTRRTNENMEDKKEAERETRKKTAKKGNEENDNGIKKGECAPMVTDNHATIGMFFMNTYNHGHCANRNPVTSPIRYCLGYCPTRTFITRKEGIWGQGHECKSCQPSRLETLRIPLECDDGFSFEKNFKNVVECACTKCKPVKGA